MATNRKNLASGILANSPGTSGTSFVLETGYGQTMPDVPFHMTTTPPGQLSTLGNSEIVEVTARVDDTLTVTRAQRGTTAKDVQSGWPIVNGVYVEDEIPASATAAGGIWWEEIGRATSTTAFTGRLNLTVNIPPEKVRNYYHVLAKTGRREGGGSSDVVQIVINQERGNDAFMQKSIIYDTAVSGSGANANGFLRIGGINEYNSYFADLTIRNIGDAGWQDLTGMAGSDGTVRTGSGRRQANGGITSISIYSDQTTSIWGVSEIIVLGHN